MKWYVEKLLDQLDTACFFTTLDLAKCYSQISLSAESKKNKLPSPFRTGCTNWPHFRHFCLLGAPVTIQHLMNWVLRLHTVAYLNDISDHVVLLVCGSIVKYQFLRNQLFMF